MYESIVSPQAPHLPEDINNEQVQNPFTKVPVSYALESGETVNGDFAFVGQLSGYQEVKKGEGILTDHPEIALDFLERGVTCLDDYIPEKDDLVIHILGTGITDDHANTNNSQTGVARTLTLHPNRTFTITDARGVIVEPFAIDPLPTRIDADSGAVFSNFHRKFGEVLETALTRYDGAATFERNPALQEKMAAIGFVSGPVLEKHRGMRDFITFPTVQRLQDEFLRLAEEDTDSGVFYPNLLFSPGGQFDGATFVDAWADIDEDGLGKYIISSDDPFYYGHDVAAEHLVALMDAGRPMMQALSRFAAIVKTAERLDLPQRSWRDNIVTLEGSKKDDRAAVIIDDFTQEFNNIIWDADHPNAHGKEYNPTAINGLVKTLREAGQLDDLEVVKFMIDTKMVENTDQVNELSMLQALDAMAKNRLQIVESEASVAA